MLKTTLKIYSLKWDRDDSYHIEMTRDNMIFTLICPTGFEEKKAIWEWEYHKEEDFELAKKALLEIMESDNIYPPVNIPTLFWCVWRAWRNSDLNDEEAIFELEQIAKWINHVTESKPKTDFLNICC